jgi:hypothetical protein
MVIVMGHLIADPLAPAMQAWHHILKLLITFSILTFYIPDHVPLLPTNILQTKLMDLLHLPHWRSADKTDGGFLSNINSPTVTFSFSPPGEHTLLENCFVSITSTPKDHPLINIERISWSYFSSLRAAMLTSSDTSSQPLLDIQRISPRETIWLDVFEVPIGGHSSSAGTVCADQDAVVALSIIRYLFFSSLSISGS